MFVDTNRIRLNKSKYEICVLCFMCLHIFIKNILNWHGLKFTIYNTNHNLELQIETLANIRKMYEEKNKKNWKYR